MALDKSKIITFVSAIVLSGCSFASDALFPSLTGDDVDESRVEAVAPTMENVDGSELNTPPTLGATDFKPLNVTQGSETGTFVGKKVVTFRNELAGLQETIKVRNATLQKIRTKTSQDASVYHNVVAVIKSKLQLGTTPGNPKLFAMWEKGQSQIQELNKDVGYMNQLATQVASDSAMTSYLLDSIRAAFNVTGAVDEDHQQLRILEDETNQTSVLIERLLSELNQDINRQQQYVENEKDSLNSLSLSIKDGQLYGESLASPVVSGYGITAAPVATPAKNALPEASVTGRPLFVVRFNKPSVSYEQGLYHAVKSALGVKPDAKFDLVAVSPAQGTQVSARRSAETVLRSLTAMGLPASRITLSSMNSSTARSNEVHLYVK